MLPPRLLLLLSATRKRMGWPMMNLFVGIGGWILSYTFFLHLLGPYADTCTQGDDSAYIASMILGPSTLALSAWLIWRGRRHAYLRWGAIPHVGTWLISIGLLSRYLSRCAIGGQFICAGGALGDDWIERSGEFWHRLYAPIHLLALGGFTLFLIIFWKMARLEDCPTSARTDGADKGGCIF